MWGLHARFTHFSFSPSLPPSPGSEVDSGGSKWYDDLSSAPAISGVVVVILLLVALIVVLVIVIIVCYCKRSRRRSQEYNVHSRSPSSSSPPSYRSSKESLDRPVMETPELSRKAKIAMEMKPLDLSALVSEDDGEMIPSGAIPVNLFREHVEKFDENRQLLFQHEFDVSDVIITSWSIYPVHVNMSPFHSTVDPGQCSHLPSRG